MAKVVVTGGAGFIGSHVINYLFEQGHEVIALDFFQQYIHPIQETFLENMNYRFQHLLHNIEFIRVSTNSLDSMRRAISACRPTHVIHLASLPLANIAIRHPEEAFDTIIKGGQNLLEIMRDQDQLQKFVYVSSSMVYGDFTTNPMQEDAQKDPKEIYGGMKYCGEILTKVYSRRYGIPYNIVRPSAVYGPTDNNRRVLQIFVENAFKGLPIVLTNPTTRLDFTFVKDIAKGLVQVTLSDSVNEDFNLTKGHAYSLREAADILLRFFPQLEVNERIKEDSYRPERGALDITKARTLCGYAPSYDLHTGLGEYIEHMKHFNPSISGSTRS